MAGNKQGRSLKEEVAVVQNYIKKFNVSREKMYVEDLAALEKLSEEAIIDVLKQRLKRGDSYSFVGDVLISLNSNELPLEYTRAVSYINHANKNVSRFSTYWWRMFQLEVHKRMSNF